MSVEFLAAAESVKNLWALLKAAHGLANYNEISAAVAEVNMQLVEAYNVALAAQQKQAAQASLIAKLEEKINNSRKWENEAKRYVLYELSPGVFVYTVKEDMGQNEPPHLLCANCYAKGKKAILQRAGCGTVYDCHNCKSYLIINKKT